MKHSPARTIGLLFLLAGASYLTACKKEPRVEQATKDKILLLGNGAEPKALDPHLVQAVGDSNVLRSLFEGLVTYHPTDDSIHVPGVAERWEANEDFSEWTFFLRKDAKWSNGDPVTAHDFVYAYNRILHPEMAAVYASMLYIVEGAKEYNEGEEDDFSKVKVKAVDDHTLFFKLRERAPYFPDVVKHTTFYPVHKATIEKFGRMSDRFTKWQRAGNHVSNGPYMLDKWGINHSVQVKRNPHYWDAENVNLNRIHFLPIDNEFTEERMFRDGLLHYTYTVPPNLIPWYKENHPEFLHIQPYAGVYFYRVNVTRPPMDNPKLRRALSLAINQEEIVEYVTMGGQIPAFGFTPPSEGGYKPPNRIRFDPEKAKQLLREAGYENGADVPTFTVFFNTLDSHKDIAQAIQAMWKKYLGIENVTIQNQEWKVFLTTVKKQNYDIARAGWIGDYVDPTTFLNMWRTNDSNNETGWSNKDFDRLLQEASQLDSTEERYKRLYEAEEILLDELPILPIYWYTRVYLLSPSVKNWNPLLLDNIPYKKIDLAAPDAS